MLRISKPLMAKLCKTLFIFFSALIYTQSAVAQGGSFDSLRLDSIIKKVELSERASSTKGIGGALFLGRGFYRGNISGYFNDPYFIGLQLDFHKRKWVFQIDDALLFSKVKQDLLFTPDKQWKKGSAAFGVVLTGNIGYTIIETDKYKIVPLAGIGFTALSSRILGTSQTDKYEPILLTYKAGAYIDLKSIPLIQSRYVDPDYYTCLRVSFGINGNIGTPRYSNFYGGPMAYISIGLGSLSRQIKEKPLSAIQYLRKYLPAHHRP